MERRPRRDGARGDRPHVWLDAHRHECCDRAGAGERYSDVRFATLRALGARVAAGVDARVRFELDRDRDEKSPGRTWDAEAGSTTSYALGRYAVTAIVGISASKLRIVDASRVGAIATLGVAGVF